MKTLEMPFRQFDRAPNAFVFEASDQSRRPKLVEMIREIVAGICLRTGRSDLIFETRLPADEGEDWNLVLQNAALDQTGLAKEPAGKIKKVRPG